MLAELPVRICTKGADVFFSRNFCLLDSRKLRLDRALIAQEVERRTSGAHAADNAGKGTEFLSFQVRQSRREKMNERKRR
jgi:hypothetical protein